MATTAAARSKEDAQGDECRSCVAGVETPMGRRDQHVHRRACGSAGCVTRLRWCRTTLVNKIPRPDLVAS